MSPTATLRGGAAALLLVLVAPEIGALETGAAEIEPVGAPAAEEPTPQPRLALESYDQGQRVRASGLSADVVERLGQEPPTAEQWRSAFRLHAGDESLPPVAARVVTAGDNLLLEPRFPLLPGRDYIVVLDLTRLGWTTTTVHRAELRTDAEPFPTDPTRLTAVYPSGPEVPENLLRVYLHFSAPMSQGSSYRWIRVLDGGGDEVELAILEIEPELWDPGTQRLTLLFDPGRIKSGLVPNRELGPALRDGAPFTLEIDGGWPDAYGRPLGTVTRHALHVGPPDRTSPDPASWSITAPRAGTRQSLEVVVDEPLDHALLRRMVWLEDPAGLPVPGTASISDGERRWTLHPSRTWDAGTYSLRIDPLLEDRAGNRVGRAFEVDSTRPELDSEPVTLREVEIGG